MKNNRQSLILDIIAKEAIETQEQLLDGTVLNEKHRKIVAQVTSGLE